MTDKLYPLRNGAVTLYVHKNYKGTEFGFQGFTIEGDENFYVPYVNVYNRVDLDGRPCVSLETYLLGMYRTLADAELAAYLEKHIHDRSFYTGGEDAAQIWYQAGKTPAPRRTTNLNLEQVVNGIVGLEVDHTTCCYDFAAHAHVEYRDANRDQPRQTTPLQIFYGSCLHQLLALEQYERGLAPPAYAELVRLSAFLAGKKSMKLVMKDGSVHEYKNHWNGEVTVRELLSIVPSDTELPFTLNDGYDLKPRLGQNCTLAHLDYLQFGRQRFVFDMAALGYCPVRSESLKTLEAEST